MKEIQAIIEMIKRDLSCICYPPIGEPMLPEGLTLPADLRTFYQSLGGIHLFPDASFPLQIVSPSNFVRANPVIVGENWEEDITYNWFIVAQSEGFGGQYITIDLGKGRMGQCYDSYWDRHVNFDCPIIANSFTDFLLQAYRTKGEIWYWAADGFNNYGMSHESIEPLN